MIQLYLAALILIAGSGLPALARGRWAVAGERLSLAILLLGSGLGLVVVAAGFGQAISPALALAWSLPGGDFRVELDPLAGIFLLPALMILALSGIYGLGYFPAARHGAAAGRLRLFYGLLGAAIGLLPVCRNGLLFLIAWEVMAIGGFFLILTEQAKEEARRAAYIYLAATHTGTLALFAMFILLAQGGDFIFPAAASLAADNGMAAAIFLLALFGFGLKAGMMPFHIWLPGAHAAAPSHVSALMSGVMIKIGIYGLVRISGLFSLPPAWWGGLVLGLGVVSAVMGVVFALAQHDIKRLLAYHSVENIGIILIGLGCALLGRSFEQPVLVALGLAGALLHVINHGLFKSLLFLAAGSVIQATGTRRIDQYGGLLRAMPRTALFFLGGAVAICGLPPLNGFVSEWLVYLGLLSGQSAGAPFPLAVAGLAVPALAMTGTLAVACFAKVFGVTFLGVARRDFAVPPREAPGSMQLPMAGLLACCLLIGLLPWSMAPWLDQAGAAWQGGEGVALRQALPDALAGGLTPLLWLSFTALLLLALIALLWHWQRSWTAAAPEERSRRPATWGCGFPTATPRMQYTAAAVAELLLRLFRWGLRSDIDGGRAIGFFPAATRLAIHTPDVVLDRLLYPAFRHLAGAALWLRALIHRGWVGAYILYVAITLCLLLFWLSA